MAIEAGATLHYKSRIDENEADIVACGPKDTSAIALGEIFHTSHPNHIAFQLNDKLAPGAYSYLIVIDGVGLICTCLWRKQKKSERFPERDHRLLPAPLPRNGHAAREAGGRKG